ncbi:hypothetical protein N7520_003819 [Penicillium odoratum]|uniref:uncharacterized protein n=1 Tax=Penicillium odoratum TaxID=1167516 RepID=UPI0025471538|nr:uncharacterized protein N7520_003819 [Penicillium odoratum]KAJ5769260.1 hypothetical protein N7520_003819 [Penicillium odoratum]
MATRASARQAAKKAKKAITGLMEGSGSEKDSAGSKRKAQPEKSPQPSKQREIQEESKTEDSADPSMGGMSATKPVEQRMSGGVPGTPDPVDPSFPPAHQIGSVSKPAANDLPDFQPIGAQPRMGSVPGSSIPIEQPAESGLYEESGVRISKDRESAVPSTIMEKGIIYFFFRPRVNIDDPHSMGDVARSFFVLRPIPLGAELDNNQGPMDKDAQCRLLMLPKKKFPTSGKERDMAFVEKVEQSVKDLQENFVASSTYQTATRGERTTEEARPYAEGVYAITLAKKSSHLAYEVTIPANIGEIQENFGLYQRGSWIVQSKNPKFPGPPSGQLPKAAAYPKSVLEKFGDLRWVPLQPEFINYPNAQILMIGGAMNSWGKAATAEGNKPLGEPEPGQELERLAEENEHRIEHLQGNETVFQDLGMHAKKYRTLPTTWSSV